jgi:dTDP-glucose 4,6-dehydratase
MRGQSRRPYNVGSEEAHSIADLAYIVRETLGVRQPVEIAGRPRLGVLPERYVPDTSRAGLELGLEQWIPLRESIRRTAQWHMAEVAA